MPSEIIDPECPLDWDHPLNRGLVLDYSIVPNSGWRGGKTLRDLVRGRKKPNDGTLAGGPTWGKRLLFTAASSQYVDCGNPFPLIGTNYTVAAYHRPVSVAASRAFFSYRFTGSLASILFQLDQVNADARFVVRDDGGTSTIATASSALVAGAGAFIVGARSGNSVTIYTWLDKGTYSTSTTSGTIGTLTAANSLNVGATTAGTTTRSSFADGPIDNVMVWNRALSLAQAKAVREEVFGGNQNRLRWVSTRTWSLPIVATTSPYLPAFSPSMGFAA